MTRQRSITIAIAILVATVASMALFCSVFPFIDKHVTEGAAYGFVVGESKSETLRRALGLRAEGAFEIFELGQGSSAVVFDPSTHDPLDYDHWQLVVDPKVWNDRIYLTFESDALVEIWRFRLCCEMP